MTKGTKLSCGHLASKPCALPAGLEVRGWLVSLFHISEGLMHGFDTMTFYYTCHPENRYPAKIRAETEHIPQLG
jgi:hypothetical protein